jgi:hypothetical protein
LDQFVPGHVYGVGTSLGSYLLAIGAADPADDESAPSDTEPAQTSPSLKAAPPPRRVPDKADKPSRTKKR